MARQNSTTFDKKPDSLDYRIAELVIAEPNLSDGEIAERIGVSRATVNDRKRHKGARYLIEDALQLKRNRIIKIARSALSAVERNIDHDDPRISLAAAALILRSIDSLLRHSDAYEGNLAKELEFKFGWGDEVKN